MGPFVNERTANRISVLARATGGESAFRFFRAGEKICPRADYTMYSRLDYTRTLTATGLMFPLHRRNGFKNAAGRTRKCPDCARGVASRNRASGRRRSQRGGSPGVEGRVGLTGLLVGKRRVRDDPRRAAINLF